VYVVGESNWQSAASGTGVGLPGMIVSRVWYRFACTVRELTSYGPAGSSDPIGSVVTSRSTISFGVGSPGCGALSSGCPHAASDTPTVPTATAAATRRTHSITISPFPSPTPNNALKGTK
jgi:hypothetical protein